MAAQNPKLAQHETAPLETPQPKTAAPKPLQPKPAPPQHKISKTAVIVGVVGVVALIFIATR